MRVLLVEDKTELCDQLKKLFKKNKIDLDIANDGENGLEFALIYDYAVIILDIMLPGISGIDVLTKFRKHSRTTPILMLTAKETVDDKVDALNNGADDYLVKPFDFAELLARVRALHRRFPILHDETVRVGNTVINRQRYEIRTNGKIVKTSIKEAVLLEYLFTNKGKFVAKETVLQILSGSNEGDISSNNIEVYVHHLRKKFPQDVSGFTIETKYGLGYRVAGGEEDV